MRLLLQSLLIATATASSQLRGEGAQTKKSPKDVEQQLLQRELSVEHHSGFAPLSCNDNITPCVTWSSKSFDPAAGTVVIPCGECVTLDVDGDDLILPNGLDIHGKLVFPDGYQIIIHTPYIFVQGELEMASTRSTSYNPDVKIVLTGDDDRMLIPHTENSEQCGEGGCNVGNRPIIVAGGKLNIKGLQDTCPSWVKLKNVVTLSPPAGSGLPTYIPPPTSDCSNIIIETNFEGGTGIGWPSQWYRNYGGTDSYETDDGINYYARFGGRTSSWNGPQTNFNPYCIVPNVNYFVTARAKLSGITSTTCLALISFFRDPGATPEKRWSNRGQKCIPAEMNDVWFEFSSVTTFDELTANPLDPTSYDRRLYWEKPPAGVDISLDDVKIFRLPQEFYPDTTQGGTCNELFINGDAQDTTIHPATHPFPARLGTQSTVSIGSEPSGLFGTNYFYAVRNRVTGYDTPRTSLWTGCIESDFVYRLSFDLRVHSSTKKQFRAQMTVTQPDGSRSWPWLVVCTLQDINDGWVNCAGDYQFRDLDASASKIVFYFISDDDSTSDIDIDNLSFSIKSGPVNGLVVQDTDGDLASCWGESSEVLITSPSLTFDDVETTSITSVNSNGDGTTTLELEDAIGATSFLDDEPEYAVEVALLSRNIQFESDNAASDKGGHLMINHTPHVGQGLQGVSFRRFGQQGKLGRYPIHFHMNGCVMGSVVSKNLVRESNQRCYVIHGSHNVTLDSNVAYDTKGHCFVLEDSGEMDNLLSKNLAAVTRKVETKIRPEETDDVPSSFWLTNPMNSFVGNVAAGSEHSGFWFEMKSSVREPTKSSLPHELRQMNPSRLPLQQFEDNTAHSCSEHGVKTYPGSGLEPDDTPAIFRNTKSYRNAGNGVFIHNSRNIVVDGGVFADNRVAIDIDRSPTCVVQDAKIIGYSPEYKAIAGPAAFRKHCPSGWPLRGVELHTYWQGGDKNTGTEVADTFFDHFGDSECDGSSALRIDQENKGYFDVTTKVSGLSFAAGNEPLSSCDAVSDLTQKMGPVDNVAIQDVDGSIMGAPGYIVSDNERMTAFASCTSHEASCTAHCPGICFRTMGLSVSTFEDDDVLLEIIETGSGVSVSFTGEYDWPLYSNGTINMNEHTKTHRSRRFFATLPSDGNYQVRFLKNGQVHWPLYVNTQYEDPGHESSSCPDFASFNVVKPEVESGYCNELIRNGDISNGVESWWATMGGVKTRDESASGQGLAITSSYRTAEWMGPSQYFDSRCMILGARYRVSTKVKLVHKDTGAPLQCDSSLGGDCPKFTMKYESGAWEDIDEGWVGLGGRDDYWDTALEWNTFSYEFTVSEQMANAGSHLLYSECRLLDALIVFDDVSVQAM